MTSEELQSLATISDLEHYHQKTISELSEVIRTASMKEFYTPSEFSEVSGLKYSNIISLCHKGKLKATQLAAKGT
ncbi:hypothetical protein JYT59_01760 [Sphingobacteriaceae bacterium AH-315-L07]|nr:hypothetical protein [Sphingobacteriaceae bacterium AH-315-L07]